MKICLSRKGLDSESGKMASPILPCGCLCPIPIPYARSDVLYSDIHFGARTLQEIRVALKSNSSNELAHLDPDLRQNALAYRPDAWRPAFGQSGAAAGHLINQGVGAGDLFIFFGWFRKTILSGGKLKFDPSDSHGRHIIFGWLEVGDVVDKLPLRGDLAFLEDHPHVRFFKQEGSRNRIYVSSETGLKAGLFSTKSESIVLTRDGGPRSQWLLDESFESLFVKRDLTYHANETRWGREGEKFTLQAVDRGQEFVFDGNRHPMAKDYFVNRIKTVMSNKPRHCSHDF